MTGELSAGRQRRCVYPQYAGSDSAAGQSWPCFGFCYTSAAGNYLPELLTPRRASIRGNSDSIGVPVSGL